MKIFDFFSGVFLLFLSFGTCILAHRLGLGRIQHPGTGLIPFGTAVLLGVMSIGLIIQTLLKVKKTVREEKIFQETRWWTLVLVLCALVGYGAFFSFLGFNLSTFLLMVFFLVVMSHQRWWLTLAFSMGIVKGGMEAVTALLGGHVDTCFQTQEWKPFVDAGKLRLLAVPAKERLKDYPNVPTWLDLGYGVYGESPGGYLAPAGLPETIRMKLEQAFKKAMEDQGFKTAIKNFSLVEQYKPGKELYAELMKVYEENKNIIPKLSIIQN